MRRASPAANAQTTLHTHFCGMPIAHPEAVRGPGAPDAPARSEGRGFHSRVPGFPRSISCLQNQTAVIGSHACAAQCAGQNFWKSSSIIEPNSRFANRMRRHRPMRCAVSGSHPCAAQAAILARQSPRTDSTRQPATYSSSAVHVDFQPAAFETVPFICVPETVPWNSRNLLLNSMYTSSPVNVQVAVEDHLVLCRAPSGS